MEQHIKRDQQLVSLKVMRLTKPELQHRIPLIADVNAVGFAAWPDVDAGDMSILRHPNIDGSDTAALYPAITATPVIISHLTNNLSLPTSFGEVYLGQTFRCCICVSNISSEPDAATAAPATASSRIELKNIELRVDMQLPTQRTVIAYDSVARGVRDRKLTPAESYEAVLTYEVKDLGMHTIICCVNYTTDDNLSDVQSFRKYFKFQSKKPIDVRTNSFNPVPNEYYLEATVQNLTATPIFFERLEACQFDKAFACDKVVPKVPDEYVDDESDPLLLFDCGEASAGSSVMKFKILQNLDRELRKLENHHRTAVLAPNESKQFLFHFSCPSEDNFIRMLRSTSPISPRLDILWRASMGERGRLQTAPLLIRRGALTPIVARLVSCPGVVKQLSHFKFTVHLYSLLNITRPETTSDVVLDLCPRRSLLKIGILYVGLSNVVLSLSGETPCRLTINAVAAEPGAQKLPPFELIVKSTGERHSIDNLAQIFVEESQHQLAGELSNQLYQQSLSSAGSTDKQT